MVVDIIGFQKTYELLKEATEAVKELDNPKQ